MKRNPHSHKGENGKVMIIGGSEIFYGAPILCALGAEASGVDLVFPFIPRNIFQTAQNHSLNFILNSFHEKHLSTKDIEPILKQSEEVDAIAIGPGLSENKETIQTIKELFLKLEIPVVIDASAILFNHTFPKKSILTPHRGEFEKLTGDKPTEQNVQKWSKNLGVTILCKGPTDIIASEKKLITNESGNALMTVGGTGDVLSGLVVGLIAQKIEAMEACHLATQALGNAAEKLSHHQASLKAVDLIDRIPKILKTLYV